MNKADKANMTKWIKQVRTILDKIQEKIDREQAID